MLFPRPSLVRLEGGLDPPGFAVQPRMSHETQQSVDNPQAVGPPRFTLRTMLLAVTALGCLFGLMSALGTVWSVAILMFGCLLAGHVLGNSLGTRLRDGAPKRFAVSRTPQDARFAATHRSAVEGSGLSRRTRPSRITLLMTCGDDSHMDYAKAVPFTEALGDLLAPQLRDRAATLPPPATANRPLPLPD